MDIFCEIVVNCHELETRIAILENHQLVEFYTEKQKGQSIVGNIYKGIVKNVLPGMGAAFIDIGLKRTAFLPYADINLSFLKESNGKSKKKALSAGQEITVQVKKNPLEKKGARLTGTLTIPGKFLIFMPYQKKVAVSRKISSNKEKDRIKQILESIKDEDVGLIVRTDTSHNTEEDFINEYNMLSKTWKLMEKQMQFAKPPACIYDENDLSFRLIRDLFNSSVNRLVIDDKKEMNRIISRLKDSNPDLASRIELYQEDSPVFDAYGIEKEIDTIFKSKIPLPSGGNITVEQTEALVAIDINSGSFVGNNSYDETIFQTNMEAAVEISRQIRLRNLSGIIVIDFIDMAKANHRAEVMQNLKQSLKRDREKNKIYTFSSLGLVEISRKRTRPDVVVAHTEHCPTCKGSGRILARDSVAVMIFRWLQRYQFAVKKQPLSIHVHPNVRQFMTENQDVPKLPKGIELIDDITLSFDEFKVFSNVTKKEIKI
jgi:ribonuclease G